MIQHTVGILMLAGALVVGFGEKVTPQEMNWVDSLKTLSQVILERGEEYYPKDLLRQRAIRRGFQRRGYENVLYDVISRDPMSALIAFLKMELWIIYSTPDFTYWIISPNPWNLAPGIPFPDDKRYPRNPFQGVYIDRK